MEVHPDRDGAQLVGEVWREWELRRECSTDRVRDVEVKVLGVPVDQPGIPQEGCHPGLAWHGVSQR